jgi:GNAT superfamily N-acetyltransferase
VSVFAKVFMEEGLSIIALRQPPSRRPSADVVDFHARLFQAPPWKTSREHVLALLQDMYAAPDFYGVFAYENAALVGVALAATRVCEGVPYLAFQSIGVRSDFHGKKVAGGKTVGRALCEHVIEEARRRRLSFVELYTRQGERAGLLYEKLNFVDEPVLPEHAGWRKMRCYLAEGPQPPRMRLSSSRDRPSIV